MANKKGAQPLVRGTGKALKPTRAKLKEAEAQLQGTQMLIKRVSENRTHSQLSQLFACDPSTVRRRLDAANTPALQQMTTDIITENLVPKAVAVLETELQRGNYEAAKDVLFGLQILQKGGKATITHVSGTPTLDAIRKERQKAIDAVEVKEVFPTEDDPSGAR